MYLKYTYMYIYYTRAKYHACIYTGNASPEVEAAFLTEWHCLPDLIEALKSPCICGMKVIPGYWITSFRCKLNHYPKDLYVKATLNCTEWTHN